MQADRKVHRYKERLNQKQRVFFGGGRMRFLPCTLFFCRSDSVDDDALPEFGPKKQLVFAVCDTIILRQQSPEMLLSRFCVVLRVSVVWDK